MRSKRGRGRGRAKAAGKAQHGEQSTKSKEGRKGLVSFRGACLGWADQAESLRAKPGSLCVPGMRSALQPRLKGDWHGETLFNTVRRERQVGARLGVKVGTCAALVTAVMVPYFEAVAARYLPTRINMKPCDLHARQPRGLNLRAQQQLESLRIVRTSAGGMTTLGAGDDGWVQQPVRQFTGFAERYEVLLC
jgi:hypothetical protein